MTARAAALCTRLLPAGKTCAQPALRGERLCRFHNDARSRAIAEQDERTYAFYEELDDMTIYQLLKTVYDKLCNIRSVVRSFGEAKLAVTVAIQHLDELKAEGFAITRVPSRTPAPSAARTPTPSMTPPQPAQNQRPPSTPNSSTMSPQPSLNQ